MPLFPIHRKTAAVLSVLLIVIIWGSASSVTKLSVENIPPYIFAFLRNIVASVCLLPYFLYRYKKSGGQEKIPPVKKVAWMGLTGVTFFYVFFNLSLYYTTATAGALIQGFIPVAIILLALIFLKEKLGPMQVAGVLLSLVGVVMLGFVGPSTGARNVLLGNVLMIFAVLSWGAYTIISKTMSRYDPVYLTTLSTWAGTVCLLPAVAIEYWNKPEWPVITAGGWAAILHLGILSSAVCYILYNRVLKTLPAVQVGNFMNLDPVVGAIIAIAVLHERITVWQVSGAVLVLAGVALTSRGKNIKPAA